LTYEKEDIFRWFLNIGFRTHETVREIVQGSPWLLSCLWAALFGFCFYMVQADLQEFGDVASIPLILGYGLIIGPLFGIFYCLICAVVFWGMGRLLGGIADWREMMNAVSWSTIPYYCKLLLLSFQFLLFREELFTTLTPIMYESGLLMLSYMFFILLETIATLWFYGVLTISVAEIHAFAWWKAVVVVGIGVLMIASTLLFGFRILIFPV